MIAKGIVVISIHKKGQSIGYIYLVAIVQDYLSFYLHFNHSKITAHEHIHLVI